MFKQLKFQKGDKVVIAPKYQKKYKKASGVGVVTSITWNASGSRRLFVCKFANGYSEALYSYELEKANGPEKSSEVKNINTSYNSETNELKITPPEGFEIDEAKSTFTRIVFKPKRLTYDGVAMKLFHNKSFYATTELGDIKTFSSYSGSGCLDANNATSKHQLECILAKNKLANVARYLNGEWKPGEYDYATRLTLDDKGNIVYQRAHSDGFYGQIVFKTTEYARQAIEILGEETIKLALEPLY